MKNTFNLVAALALTGICFGANAQTAKPMPKEGKMESKSEEKMESKKEEKMESAKSGKMHSGNKMHGTKMAPKSKM